MADARNRTEERVSKVEFSSVAQMRVAVTNSGSKFFSPANMKWHGSKIHGGVRRKHYFITSEWTGFERNKRAFNVRWFTQETPDAMMSSHTLGDELSIYPTLDAARRAISELEG